MSLRRPRRCKQAPKHVRGRAMSPNTAPPQRQGALPETDQRSKLSRKCWSAPSSRPAGCCSLSWVSPAPWFPPLGPPPPPSYICPSASLPRWRTQTYLLPASPLTDRYDLIRAHFTHLANIAGVKNLIESPDVVLSWREMLIGTQTTVLAAF